MDIAILKKLGLSDKEIKVYLSLLEYDDATVRSLAEVSGLNRGTTYDTLKNLRKAGLVVFFKKGAKQRFAAEDPEKIYSLVEKKEEEIEEIKEKIHEFIPELKSLQGNKEERPSSKLFEGRKGIRTILKDILDSLKKGEEYYIYSAKRASEDIRAAYPDFTKDRIKKGIGVKSISLAQGGGMHGLDERRWLDANDESATFILIYAGKCAFISRDSLNNPIGIIIENKMIYETQKTIFLSLWKFLEKK